MTQLFPVLRVLRGGGARTPTRAPLRLISPGETVRPHALALSFPEDEVPLCYPPALVMPTPLMRLAVALDE